jgi:uncharacterized repeat protein (TIGR03803 family)
MKKLYAFLLLLQIVSVYTALKAQGIYQFWGTTTHGGNDDQGLIFSTRSNGTGLSIQHLFEVKNPGKIPNTGFTACNGKLYKLTRFGGLLGRGMIIEYDPVANTTRNAASLAHLNGGGATSRLTMVNNKLYGVLAEETGFWKGPAVLFEFDPATGSLNSRHTFADADGGPTMSDLTYYNGRLFGISSEGGNNGYGHIYAYDLASGSMSKRLSFNVIPGVSYDQQMLLHNNKFYLTGSNLVEYNPNTNIATIKLSFKDLFDADAYKALVVYNNKIYGGVYISKIDGTEGKLIEYDIATNQAIVRGDFTSIGGTSLYGVTVFNNRIIGTSGKGANGKGMLFEFNPATNAFYPKFHFGNNMGDDPNGFLMEYAGRLYGQTTGGGHYNEGTIFYYEPVQNAVVRKFDYGGGIYAPAGKLVYYLGELYGITTRGGYANTGVIFSYDLATGTFKDRYHFPANNTPPGYENGLILYNNKFYGSIRQESGGLLFEFNPNNLQFKVLHNFIPATGTRPLSYPTVYNGKLYGATNLGGNSNKGVIYEYNLATSTYSVKVHFGNAFGENGGGALSLYKNKLIGCTENGGANGEGTLFEYYPDNNGMIVRYHFSEGSGHGTRNALTLYNDRFYGMTPVDGPNNAVGALFTYDPNTFAFANLHGFIPPANAQGLNSLTAFNNKLYGLTRMGGPLLDHGGNMFEYDLTNGSFMNLNDFTGENGRLPEGNEMLVLPALVAPGIPGSCQSVDPATIDTKNAHEWVPFTDDEGKAVAEINANGNILGNVRVNFYTHDGSIRKDEAGRLYLNRNITITTQFAPATPVSVRLYVKKSEFDELKATPGSGINNHTDITIFKNDDACSDAVHATALPQSSSAAFWGLDYVYTLQVSSFSSFFFASKAYTALPVTLEYFRGSVKPDHNLLQWKANCTNDVDFIVERSTDGIHYTQAGIVWASKADCNLPFQFKDEHPVAGKAWYRLQIKEPDAAPEYSSIIELNRGFAGNLQVKVLPNPVTGSQLVMQISSPKQEQLRIFITDMQGRILKQQTLNVQKGEQKQTLPVAGLPAGAYQLVLQSALTREVTRFVKQ